MCRKVVFKGTCPQCTNTFIWDELSQELSCLEAKNNGVFGMCKEGIHVDEKPHDQECDPCLAEMAADEGYDGGMDDVEAFEFVGGAWHWAKKEAADRDQDSGKHKNKKQRTA
ncbi:hypothetical protein MMYC01_201499 [Madurella mycetomatis]|uniref:Uncharacterized protein n=1 Tax=Madurella mycetomatis TaxID=100816 RepID=A0A175WEC5_9PEZI|nr:hypothetical protein MMYC01_201499 [Madurella mycetomatis]